MRFMRHSWAGSVAKKISSMVFCTEWDVECADGIHHIWAEHKSQSSVPIKLFVDDRHIANIDTQSNNRAITNFLAAEKS